MSRYPGNNKVPVVIKGEVCYLKPDTARRLVKIGMAKYIEIESALLMPDETAMLPRPRGRKCS